MTAVKKKPIELKIMLTWRKVVHFETAKQYNLLFTVVVPSFAVGHCRFSELLYDLNFRTVTKVPVLPTEMILVFHLQNKTVSFGKFRGSKATFQRILLM